MAKLKNIGSDHVLENGKTVARGEVFEGPENLLTKFVNKFELVSGGEGEEKKAPAKNVKAQDVTAKFAEAKELGLKVSKKGDEYFVKDGNKILNDEALTEGDVVDFIKGIE